MKAWGIEHAPTHSIHTTTTTTAHAATSVTHTTTDVTTIPATSTTHTTHTNTSSEQQQYKVHEVDDDCYVLFVGDSIDDM